MNISALLRRCLQCCSRSGCSTCSGFLLASHPSPPCCPSCFFVLSCFIRSSYFLAFCYLFCPLPFCASRSFLIFLFLLRPSRSPSIPFQRPFDSFLVLISYRYWLFLDPFSYFPLSSLPPVIYWSGSWSLHHSIMTLLQLYSHSWSTSNERTITNHSTWLLGTILHTATPVSYTHLTLPTICSV